MTEFEPTEAVEEVSHRKLTGITIQELIDAGGSSACFGCSTAQLRTNTGHFDRECPGPIQAVDSLGKVGTKQFCQYPTGPDFATFVGEVLKPKIVISYMGGNSVMVGDDGPVHVSRGPTISGYRDWGPERLKTLLFVIDHQGESLTHRQIHRQTSQSHDHQSPNSASSIRSWFVGLKTADGERIIETSKHDNTWYIQSSEKFDLVADQSLRDIVTELDEAGE